MALIAWWKLDGNAEDSIGDNHGTAINVNWVPGKTRLCGYFNASSGSWIAIENFNFPLSKQFSYSVWAFPYSWDNKYRTIISKGNRQEDFTLRHSRSISNNNTVHTSLTTNINRFSAGSYEPEIPANLDNVWNHYVLTYDGNTLKFYINYEEHFSKNINIEGIIEFTTKNLYIGRIDPSDTDEFWHGLISDVRLYDHALSSKEIKELSKAKTLHYTFNEFQEPTENLLNNPFQLNLWTVAHGEINYDATERAYKLEQTINEGNTTNRIAQNFNYDPTAYYTLQVIVKPEPNGTPAIGYGTGHTNNAIRYHESTNSITIGNTFENGGFENLEDGWVRIWGVFSGNNVTRNDVRIWSNTSSGNIGSYCYLRKAQLEKKKYATPFVENYRAAKINDVSGHNNTSTLNLETTPRWVKSSKIGGGAYEFKEGTLIKTDNSISMLNDYKGFTISYWVKFKSLTGDWAYAIHMNEGSTNIGSSAFWGGHTNSNKLVLTIGGQDAGHSAGATNITPVLGEWYHMCAKWDGSLVKVYINGNEETSYNLTSVTNQTSLVRIGSHDNNYRYMNGLVDDIRIYSRGLSYNEIKELYQQRASIDNKGNYFAQEYNEIQGTVSDYSWSTYAGVDNSFSNVEDGYIHVFNQAFSSSTNSGASTNINLTGIDKLYVHLYYKTWRNSTSGNNETGSFRIFINSEVEFILSVQMPKEEDSINTVIELDTSSYSGTNNLEFDLRDHNSNEGESVLYIYDITTKPSNLLTKKGIQKSIISEVGPTHGLIGWWPLNGNTEDMSGEGNNGINNNGVVVPGLNQLAYEFDGNGWINLGDSLYLPDNHPFTLSGWVNYNSFSTRDMMLSRNDAVKSGSPYTWLLGTRDGNRMYAYDGSSWSQRSYSFSTGTWYHLTFRFDGTTMHYYVNGESIGTTSWSFSDSITGRNTQIGGYSGTTGDIDGKTFDIRFYDRALSAEEIKIIYDITKPGGPRVKKTKTGIYIKGEFGEE